MIRPTTNQGLPILNIQSNKHKKSILDRPIIRTALLPHSSEKKEISFSPTGYYDDETDITVIHEYVQRAFQYKLSEIPKIEKQIQQLQNKIDTETLKIITRKSLEKEMLELQKKKISIESNQTWKEYLEQALPILHEWNALREKDGPYIKFGCEKIFSPDKLSLVRSFIQIATEYAPLNLNIRPIGRPGLCPYCRNMFDTREEGKVICYECGIYQDSLTNDVTFSDLSRINGASNSIYTNKETIEKAIACYQGKEEVVFPKDIFKHLDTYCDENRINKYTLNPNIAREIFKKIGYSSYYDHVNLFLYMYIRRKLPDISQHESVLLQDHALFSQKYQIVKDDRYSSLNAQYVLYILIRRRKIPHDINDFKLPETRTIRLENDRIARNVFLALDAERNDLHSLPWKFEDTI